MKVVWACLKVSGLAKAFQKGTVNGIKKKRQTEEELGRQYQRVDSEGLCQLNQGSLRQDKIKRGCCEVICGVPTTLHGYWID